MELRALRYFVAVASQLSYRRAAESLFVSQSNLSEHIAALESELGSKLFDRSKRSIALTPAGHHLLVGAQKLLEDEGILAEQVRQIGLNHPLPSKVSMSMEEPVLANSDVCNAIVETMQLLKRQNGPLMFDLHHEGKPLPNGKFPELNTDVLFCVSRTPRWSSKFSSVVLSADRFVIAVAKTLLSADGAITTPFDLLTRYPLFLLENEGQGLQEVFEVLSSIGCHPEEIRFCKSDTSVILQVVAEKGITIVPRKKALNYEHIGVTCVDLPFDEESCRINLYAVYPASNQNPIITALLNELSARL